jgi:two-component system sensor histidine kinase/response regulator
VPYLIRLGILDYSKIEAGKMELEQITFCLDEVLNNLNDIVREKAEQKSIEIVFSMAKETPHYLKGDPLRFPCRRVLVQRRDISALRG